MLNPIPAGSFDQVNLALAVLVCGLCYWRNKRFFAACALTTGLFIQSAIYNMDTTSALPYGVVDFIIGCAVVALSPDGDRRIQAALWGFIVFVHGLITFGIATSEGGGIAYKLAGLVSLLIIAGGGDLAVGVVRYIRLAYNRLAYLYPGTVFSVAKRASHPHPSGDKGTDHSRSEAADLILWGRY